MATPAQINANRANATRSTGPRTASGKRNSAANATKHGLSSADPVLPHESRPEYDRLFEVYCNQFQPTNQHEIFLIHQMTHSSWRLARIQRLETHYLDSLLDGTGDDNPDTAILASMEKNGTHILDTLQRYAAAAERSYYRAHKELLASRKTAAPPSIAAQNREMDRIIAEYINAPLEPAAPPAPIPNIGNRFEV